MAHFLLRKWATHMMKAERRPLMASTIQSIPRILNHDPTNANQDNPAAFNRVLLDFLSHRLKE
jgi:hypothetical protein